MALSHPIYSHFAGGEITGRLLGRVDLKKYQGACEIEENFISVPHGPAIRRAGTRFVSEVKNSANRTYIMPFVYSTLQAYIVEMGNLYARFYKNNGQIQDGGSPQEVVTPYVVADIPTIKWAQSADVLYLGQSKYSPRKLERRNDPSPPPAEAWTFTQIEFTPPPTYVADTNLASNLTLSAATVGASRTATAAGAVFYPADVDRELFEVDADGNATGGSAIIRAIGAGAYPVTAVTIDIVTAFSGTSLLQLWRLGGSPSATVKPDKRSPVGASTLLTMSNETPPGSITAQLAGAGAGNVTAGAHLYKVTFVTDTGETNGGTSSATVTTTATDGQVNLKDIPVGASGRVKSRKIYRTAAGGDQYKLLTTISDNTTRDFADNVADGSLGATIPTANTATVEGWRTGDVGKYVIINNGVVKITERVDSRVVRGEILARMENTNEAIGGLWTLEVSTWDATRGFPACPALFGQRLGWGGSTKEPSNIWLSVVGDGEYENHSRGTEDDDAFVGTMTGNEVNVIRWMLPLKVLLVGTTSGEFKLRGATDKAITPTNRQADGETAYGSSEIPAVRVGHAAVYVQASGRRVRELAYSLDNDAYKSTDLLKYSEHLTKTYGITRIAFQKNPDPILWCVRSDGVLLAFTYEKDEEVFAWSRQLTGTPTTDPFGTTVPDTGFVEDVAVIPGPDGTRDQVWLVVRRIINGATKRYIEYIDDGDNPFGTYVKLNTDSALTYNGMVTDATTLTLSDASVGTGRAATSSASFFLVSDVGKELWHPDGRKYGRAVVTGFTNGTTVTVEVKIAFADGVGPYTGWFVAITSATGLGHLANATVDLVGDGAVYPQQTVTEVSPGVWGVTIDPAAALVEIGLHYKSTLKPVRPEIATASGTSQGLPRHWSNIKVRVMDTLGVNINGEVVPFRSAGDDMDTVPPIFTGDVDVNSLGIDEDGYVVIEQDQPLPCTVVAVFGRMSLGDS